MRTYHRRAVLGAGIAAVGAVAGAAAGGGLLAAASRAGAAVPGDGYLAPDGPEVAAAEKARAGDGPVTEVRLTAVEGVVDLGGPTVRTWTYDGELPGKEIRVTAGGSLSATLANHLPQTTSAHWHGLAVRNDMDGVPGLTQSPIKAGAEFAYRFAVQRPGTYWFHPHTGVQLDRGLYAPLIVEDPKEPLQYDKEWVVVLDDWVDGVDGSTPDAVLAELMHGAPRTGMAGMAGTDDPPGQGPAVPAGPSRLLTGATSYLLSGEAGDVRYPYYLVNGRVPQAPRGFTAKPGDRIRIRFINAGGDTAFRVALGDHRMTVTHTDGYPVVHADTDALLIGMGERYDVLVTAGDGVFPLVALAEGKDAAALDVLRTGVGTAPTPADRPRELSGELLQAGDLRADPSVALTDPGRTPDRFLTLRLTGSMARYDWGFDGSAYDPAVRQDVRQGERVRLTIANNTRMWHPLHVHGHTFSLTGGGARKDTAIVLPGRTRSVDLDADNPGLWMVHCHNVYHAEAGMMTVLGYRQ
ncbi:multicopper oxidase family protein [Streptomyces sp. SPB162]|uniref:multicopper oxidase family protein n=1 Tax=Streptomyces sp. SPB162 TaxID=2940560 RepID=UPI0024059A19|nr:multicopper oxidase family protein [Streptomyces sp. SPB162]MDF9812795.1 FtsP/CotA-like multicopper oxidase with cupredoxin domain [Streptomyces sp. SPB162]